MEETCLFDVAMLKQAQIEYTIKDVLSGQAPCTRIFVR